MFHNLLYDRDWLRSFLSKIGSKIYKKIWTWAINDKNFLEDSNFSADKKLAIIGTGNFGTTFAKKISDEVIDSDEIIASNPNGSNFEELERVGIETTSSNIEAARRSEMVFLTVKPDTVKKVLNQIQLSKEKLLVSVAAGIPIEYLKTNTEAKVVRTMPNICVEVGEMATAYSKSRNVTNKDEKAVKKVFNSIGTIQRVQEDKIDTVTGLSGSGPAFIFMVIRAMMESGIKLGLSRKEALELTIQTVKGSAEMVRKSEKEVEDLIDKVASPNGTTIEGLKVLEENEVKDSFQKAVQSAAERANELSE